MIFLLINSWFSKKVKNPVILKVLIFISAMLRLIKLNEYFYIPLYYTENFVIIKIHVNASRKGVNL